MMQTMVRGTILVRATKTQIENSNDYYFEFQLNEMQTQQLATQLLVDHIANGTLTMIQKQEGDITEKERTASFLKSVLELYSSTMSEEVKLKYLETILDLSTKR